MKQSEDFYRKTQKLIHTIQAKERELWRRQEKNKKYSYSNPKIWELKDHRGLEDTVRGLKQELDSRLKMS